MIYILTSFFSFIFCYSIYLVSNRNIAARKINHKCVIFILLFLSILWVTINGSQDDVGTDYKSYYSIFRDGHYDRYWRYNKEYLFALIVKYISLLNINPQYGFVILSSVMMAFFIFFILKFNFERIDLLVFIYFYSTTVFMNQMNLLRQYTAMYIFLYAIYYIYSKRFFPYCLLIVFASFFHRSALFLIPIYFLNSYFLKYDKKNFIIEILITICFIIVAPDKIIGVLLRNTIYATYLRKEYHLSIINMITKMIYFPFYFKVLFSNVRRDNKAKWLIHFGFVGYCFKLISLTSIMSRFGIYFDFIAYIPLYYYLNDLIFNKYKKKKYENISILFVFLCVILIPYILKVIVFPVGEFKYKSLLFNTNF